MIYVRDRLKVEWGEMGQKMLPTKIQTARDTTRNYECAILTFVYTTCMRVHACV